MTNLVTLEDYDSNFEKLTMDVNQTQNLNQTVWCEKLCVPTKPIGIGVWRCEKTTPQLNTLEKFAFSHCE